MKKYQKTWKLLVQLFISYLKPGIFGKSKILLSFEYGFVISDIAKKLDVEITPEIMNRAERILLDVARGSTSERMAVDMIPNILAIFETDMGK